MVHLNSPLPLQLYEQKPSLLTINKGNVIWLNVNAGYGSYLAFNSAYTHKKTVAYTSWNTPYIEPTLSRARATINTLHHTQELPALTVNLQEHNIIWTLTNQLKKL